MLWNILTLSFRSILRNMMRSILTILGIVVGVCAVVTMVTLGNGATRSISSQIASMGSNLLMVMPGQRFGLTAEAAARFKDSDVEAIRNQISAVDFVAPVVTISATAVFQSNNWATSVNGSNGDYFMAGNWQLADGRIFNEAEQRAGKSVCILGETVRKKLFGSQNPVGYEIRIKQFTCNVVGVLKPKGQSAMGSDQDDVVVMPLRTVQRRLAGSNDISEIMISVHKGISIDKTKEKLTLLLRERRKISETEDDDFQVMDTRQIAETLTSTTRILTMLLGAVAAVSLLVGGIGIMNIMLVSVTERTREIGTRLAIGALEGEVMLQFLIEAVVLSCLGGIVGIMLATVSSILLSHFMQVPFEFDISINIVSVLFAASIGILFGYFPAQRAARLDPIEALRHE